MLCFAPLKYIHLWRMMTTFHYSIVMSISVLHLEVIIVLLILHVNYTYRNQVNPIVRLLVQIVDLKEYFSSLISGIWLEINFTRFTIWPGVPVCPGEFASCRHWLHWIICMKSILARFLWSCNLHRISQ